MPKKTFSSGETLLASDVNTYLMNQTVMVFDDSAARSTAIPSPSEGMVTYLKDVDLVQAFDGSDWIEISGGASVTVSETAPSGAEAGDMWFSSSDGRTFVYYTDVDGSQWVEIGTVLGGGGASIEVAATAPADPANGDLWWDTDNGNLYLYYDDGDSQQWVAANGPQVFVGTSAPAGYQGQLWFDSTDGKTYIYYDDGTSGQWVSAIGGSLSGNVIQVVSTTKSDTFTSSSTSFTNLTGLSASITPKSTSSKILVVVDISLNGTGGQHVLGKLLRDSTAIGGGDVAGSRQTAFANCYVTTGNEGQSMGMNYLDSPATTSSVTYQVQMGTNTGTFYVNRASDDTDSSLINRARTASTITLMEIAG